MQTSSFFSAQPDHFEVSTSFASQSGAILILALVFLAMFGLLASTLMQTGTLELRMARNHQFQLEAFHLAQGVASAISAHSANFPLSTSVNSVLCKNSNTTTGCSANIAIHDPNLVTVPAGVSVEYRVERLAPLLQKGFPVRLGEKQVSSGVAYDAALFEAHVIVDATAAGQGAAQVAVGMAVLSASSERSQ